MSIQLQIYLERAGIISEDKKLDKKIEDFLEFLRQRDREEENDGDEHPDDVEPSEWDDEEDDKDNKRNLKEARVPKEPRPPKEKNYTSNDKGVLHELLVGKHLLGRHMTLHEGKFGDTPEQAHDKIKAALYKKHGNHDEYNRLNAKAESAAKDIKKHAEKNGYKIHDVHWTSKHGDIKKSTGVEASQKEDASDIMIHTHHPKKPKSTHFIGASLKVTDQVSPHITASNPGMETTPDAKETIDEHRKAILKAHPKLVGVTNADDRKKMMDSDPKMKSDILKRNGNTIKKLAGSLHKSLAGGTKANLIHHIKTHVLQANETPLQHLGHEHIRHTTHMAKKRDGGGLSHHSIVPSDHWKHILDDPKEHKHITVVHHNGGDTVHFMHRGKLFASHRIRVASSSDPSTGFKGDGKAHGD
jgi:hypothetical protein